MTRIISALLVAISSAAFAASAVAQEAMPKEGTPIELVADAPDRYIVTPGDTLWGIAARFVKDPYRWPDLWRLNEEQLKNPHRIYPGQVLVLKRGEAPQLEVDTVRISPKQITTPLAQEIPAIPQAIIAPYLARPLIIEANALDSAPRIIAMPEGRLMVGNGDSVYATGVKAKTAEVFQIYRPGRAMTDPATKKVLGLEAIYLGTAKVVRAGEPATLRISGAVKEISVGDRLTPQTAPEVVSYVPRAPKQKIDGRIISALGTVIGGQYSIVSINRGKRDGVEIGHVLALRQAGTAVTDTFKDKKQTYMLPDERYGLVFVFRVFDAISYALVMKATQEIDAGDIVSTP